MDFITEMIYDANFLICACKVVGFLFSLEALSYLVAVVMGVAKACLD